MASRLKPQSEPTLKAGSLPPSEQAIDGRGMQLHRGMQLQFSSAICSAAKLKAGFDLLNGFAKTFVSPGAK
jgi:hypothetical protein